MIAGDLPSKEVGEEEQNDSRVVERGKMNVGCSVAEHNYTLT